jgi:hypothetical protein
MPLEHTGVALTFLAFFVAAKTGKTGLSPTVDVFKSDGTQIVTAGSATAVGGGLYRYTLASGSNDAEELYTCIFKTTDATVDQQHLPALWCVQKAGIENLDAAVSSRSTLTAQQVWDALTSALSTVGSVGKLLVDKLGLLGTGTVNVSAPVSSDGVTVTTKQGHAYSAADGLAIEWTVTGYPTFVGGTVAVRIQTPTAVTVLTGSVVDADTLRLELTSAQSAAIDAGSWPFDVDVTLASARVVTPVQGDWISEAQV